MADIFMVADPSAHTYEPGPLKTLWLSTEEFWRLEELVKKHDEVLWQSFHTHGEYARTVKLATWFAVAVDAKGQFVSSAFVIVVGRKWLMEYVMTDPDQRAKGAGSSVIREVMRRAKEQLAQWVILNCDPAKNGGKLPAFYGKFGFTKVA